MKTISFNKMKLYLKKLKKVQLKRKINNKYKINLKK